MAHIESGAGNGSRIGQAAGHHAVAEALAGARPEARRLRHWRLLGEAPIPGSRRCLQLHRDKDHFYIGISHGGGELMSTRKHGSEDALGRLACQRLADKEHARALVGGLGMGFTLAAALAELGAAAEVTVAELVPEVIEWNRGPLGAFSGRPLDDPRTRVYAGDVARVLRRSRDCFDAIMLDVDNGPEGITQADNDRLYSPAGIELAQRALRPNGVLAYWSAAPDAAFPDRLRRSGLTVEEHSVHAHGNKGVRHTLWLAFS